MNLRTDLPTIRHAVDVAFFRSFLAHSIDPGKGLNAAAGPQALALIGANPAVRRLLRTSLRSVCRQYASKEKETKEENTSLRCTLRKKTSLPRPRRAFIFTG